MYSFCSLEITTFSFISLQLLPHSHINFCHVPHPCCHLSVSGTICPHALSLSPPVALSSHPRFGVNSRKDTRAEMLTKSGQRKRMNGSSWRAHHSTDSSECFIKANNRGKSILLFFSTSNRFSFICSKKKHLHIHRSLQYIYTHYTHTRTFLLL